MASIAMGGLGVPAILAGMQWLLALTLIATESTGPAGVRDVGTSLGILAIPMFVVATLVFLLAAS